MHLGMFLSDLTFLQENPNEIDGLVNFTKMEILGEILMTVKKVQQCEYKNLSESAFLKEYLKKALVLDDDQLYQVALQIYSVSDKRRASMRSQRRTFSK